MNFRADLKKLIDGLRGAPLYSHPNKIRLGELPVYYLRYEGRVSVRPEADQWGVVIINSLADDAKADPYDGIEDVVKVVWDGLKASEFAIPRTCLPLYELKVSARTCTGVLIIVEGC